jgi:hypothetical protein
MGRNSGGVNGYSKVGATMVGVTSTGKKLTAKQTATVQSSSESLDSLKHREVTKQLNRAISRYEKVMGVRERTIRVADTPGAYGVTFLNSNGSQGIYLSKSLFNQSRNKIEADYRKQNYDTGFKNKTNRPIQHTLTHELAHAHGRVLMMLLNIRQQAKKFQVSIRNGQKIKKKQGYGSYGKSNVDEFWAEVVTKGVHGKSDKYTRKAISIAHSYKL